MKGFRAVTLVFLLGTGCNLQAQTDSTQFYFSKGKEAYNSGRHAEFYLMLSKAYRLNPYHPRIVYQYAIAAALSGKATEALGLLKMALHENAKIDLTNKDLATVALTPGYQELLTLQADLQRPLISSDTAFIIPDRQLHIESIATGEDEGIFYASSIHRSLIIRIANGEISHFTESGQDGLTSVFGLKADKKRKLLWASASPMDQTASKTPGAGSAVFLYDLTTRQLLRKFHTPKTTKMESVLGDLILDRDGRPYISDSKNNLILRVNESTDTLEVFFGSDQFWNIQGIAFDDRGTSLFIADYIKGIYKLDVKSKQLSKLKQTFDYSTKSIDGLLFYKDHLIGIQNYIYPMRVGMYKLDRDHTTLVDHRIIDKAHPAFNEPTNGCIAGDRLVYVANSLWSGYTEDFQLKAFNELAEPVILSVNLRSLR